MVIAEGNRGPAKWWKGKWGSWGAAAQKTLVGGSMGDLGLGHAELALSRGIMVSEGGQEGHRATSMEVECRDWRTHNNLAMNEDRELHGVSAPEVDGRVAHRELGREWW
ncbi:hypothetical protein KIL84_003835 [Mauremys mutica]|uniref:Uncharacterized protein n=1 Tax=Mauremys mutica TaxID=74926 RepID=A0A9D3WUL5_9SAUR|nr:hypothetical protein KIL84_003835 [Mauremys mutica]